MKCEAMVEKCDAVGSNTLKKPFTRRLGEEGNKIANHILALRIAPLVKGDVNTGRKTSEYTPYPDDEMVEDNFDT